MNVLAMVFFQFLWLAIFLLWGAAILFILRGVIQDMFFPEVDGLEIYDDVAVEISSEHVILDVSQLAIAHSVIPYVRTNNDDKLPLLHV